MAAHPLKSEGARIERDAWFEYLDRQLKVAQGTDNHGLAQFIVKARRWGLERRRRYGKSIGGLGKK